MKRLNFLVAFLFFSSFLFSFTAYSQESSPEPEWNVRNDIFLTLDQALKAVFPDADQIKQEIIQLSVEARERIAKAIGHLVHEQDFVVYQGFKQNELLGYAIVGEEIGKFRPITSIVMVGLDGKVKDVAVMVYRESHGADVKRKRFLHQYKGKGVKDPIRINRDIASVSGATISVHAMNAQVRKVLHVIHETYFQEFHSFKSQIMAMGVLNAIEVRGVPPQKAEKTVQEAFKLLQDLDAKLSHYKETSEISKINQLGASRPQPVSEDTFEVIEKSVEFYRESGGAFDITVFPLVKAWGIFQGKYRLLSQQEIEGILPLIGSDKLILDRVSKKVGFKTQGMAIELGAIGKGYACDRLLEFLKNHQIKNAHVDIGGNICVLGASDKEEGWLIGIRNPMKPDEIFKTVLLKDRAIATSGNYENYFIGEYGKRYTHILDPKTGYPVEKTIAVSVVASSGLIADALSTALFVLGPDHAPKLARKYPDIEWWITYKKSDTVIYTDYYKGAKCLSQEVM